MELDFAPSGANIFNIQYYNITKLPYWQLLLSVFVFVVMVYIDKYVCACVCMCMSVRMCERIDHMARPEFCRSSYICIICGYIIMLSVCVYTCVCAHASTYTYMCMYVYVYVHVCVCVCACMYKMAIA